MTLSTIRSAKYQKDGFYLTSSLNVQEHSTLIKESYISDLFKDFTNKDNVQTSLLSKSQFIKEFNMGVMTAEDPYVVSLSMSTDWISIGEEVTIDMTVNEELRNWSVRCDLVTPSSVAYDNLHLYVVLMPGSEVDGVYSIDLTLIDSGGNIGEQSVTFSITVDDDGRRVIVNHLSDSEISEAYANKIDARGIAFQLKSTAKEQKILGIGVSYNQSVVGDYVDRVSLFDLSANATVAVFSTPAAQMYITMNCTTTFNAQGKLTIYSLM